MLHIVLLILKIIGIVLLCMLGVIILALVCVLFVPVRYRIEAVREEGDDQPPVVVRVKVTWLLHLLNISIRYPAEVMVRVRLMIFTVLKMPDRKESEGQEPGTEKKAKRKKREKKTKEKEAKGKKAKEKKATEKKSTEKKATEKKSKERKSKEKKETEEKGAAEINDALDYGNQGTEQKRAKTLGREKVPAVTIKATAESEESLSFIDKIRALPVILKMIFEKIKSLFENIQYTIRSLCDKIKSVSDNIQYYKAVVESDIFQNAFGLCKEELVTILMSLKPQKFEAKLIVGMDDPAATGQILSICGMLYPVLGGRLDVSGDFERKRIEGQVLIKGKIRFSTFLRAAVRIYLNKDLKRLLKLLKKEAV